MSTLLRNRRVFIGEDVQDDFPTVNHYATLRSVDKKLWLSSGHYGYPYFGNRKNVGGPFHLTGSKTTHQPSARRVHWRGGANNQFYDGLFYANINPYGAPTSAINDGSAWMAEAYNKMKPTEPEFQFLNAAYELRELPGMLRQRFLKNGGLHTIADYYLALQFGWKPLLRDVRNLVEFQRRAQKRLKQLLRDNGKPVRRSIMLSDTATTPVITSGSLYAALQPVLVTQYYASQPTWRQTEWSEERIWASARFRYWLPGGPRDIAWRRKMINRLFGLTPSPKVIYNAIPWTWLIDWFSNLGDLIGNLDDGVADRLAADYTYVMRERHNYREYYAQGKFRDRSGKTFSVSASALSDQLRLTRVAGGPFDPSVLENDLNGTQLAILGALGLSRMK